MVDKIVRCKSKTNEHLLQFTQIPQSLARWGLVGRRQRFQCKLDTFEKGVAEKSLQLI